jgi:hypothetical protein
MTAFFSCVRIYRASFGCENDRFRENKPKTLVFSPIRTQRRWCQLVLDEIRLGGSFQILGLRRGRDQQVFMPETKSMNVRYVGNTFIVFFSPETPEIA